VAIPPQSIVPGQFENAFAREQDLLLRERGVERLWAKDLSLWPNPEFDRERIASDLRWLDLPDLLDPLLRVVAQGELSAKADGLEHRVLLALENANLYARALLGFSSLRSSNFLVFDTMCPFSIRRLESRFDLRKTLFFLANKTTYQLEDHCLFLYFLNRLHESQVQRPARHFISQTQPGTFLAALTRGHEFRLSLDVPAGILATYTSALTFAPLLLALSVATPDDILAASQQARNTCSRPDPFPQNPALALAAFLCAAALAPRRYIAFLASPSLVPYTHCLRQLLVGLTGKRNEGLMPIVGDVPRNARVLEDSAAVVVLNHPADNDLELLEMLSRFRSSAIPFTLIQLDQPLDLLAETFKWELASVLACARLGLDPFDWPETREPRSLAMSTLDKLSARDGPLRRTPRVKDSAIQLFAEGKTRIELSTLNLVEAIHTFLRLSTPDSFLALLVYFDRAPSVSAILRELSRKLMESLRVPVLTAFGPHSTEYYGHHFYPGFPKSLYIALTADSPVDLAIPGAPYSFSQLHRALVLGEIDALVRADRIVIRLHLSSLPESLHHLDRLVEKVLRRFRI
jgi:hypothetical protein